MRISYHETHRDKVDERGFYQISNHCIVTRRFDKIRELSIDDFNHQNVLAGIVFQMMEDTLHVTVEGIFGLAARFQCSQATVEGVTRKTRDGKKETCPNTKG
jgi:hypothetical protein